MSTSTDLMHWRFERLGEREIRITDPDAPFSLVITLDDQASAMRILWRLAVALLDAGHGASAPPSAADQIKAAGRCADCDLINGCPEFCRCQSSAQVNACSCPSGDASLLGITAASKPPVLTKPEIEREFFRIQKLLPERVGLVVFDCFIDGVRFAERKHGIGEAHPPIQASGASSLG